MEQKYGTLSKIFDIVWSIITFPLSIIFMIIIHLFFRKEVEEFKKIF